MNNSKTYLDFKNKEEGRGADTAAALRNKIKILRRATKY